MPKYVNEASSCTVRARFYNLTNDLATPQNARYRIKDLTNDRVVTDWTDISVTGSVDIEISGAENEVISSKRFERRVLTVMADVDLPTQVANEIEYWVKNLAGIDNG